MKTIAWEGIEVVIPDMPPEFVWDIDDFTELTLYLLSSDKRKYVHNGRETLAWLSNRAWVDSREAVGTFTPIGIGAGSSKTFNSIQDFVDYASVLYMLGGPDK